MANANEVLFITDENSKYLFVDLLQVEDIKKYIIRASNYKLINIVRKIHLTPKLSKYIWLPKRDIWFDKKYIINNTPQNGYILVNSSVMVLPSVEFWNDIQRNRPDVKFVLLLVDSMNVKGGHMVVTRKRLKEIKWDLVLSYDKYDCEEYGFKYIGFDYYSPRCVNKTDIDIDLYYISSVKSGRADVLRSLNRECANKKIKTLFQIMSRWRKIDYGQVLRSYLKYDEVVSNIMRSNCILEIMQDGQNAQTIRYLEAVCYNKKLLTNNKRIIDYPYYNEKYMKIFTTVDEIEWDWVLNRENVKYTDCDFSSVNLLKYL